jgi:putative oxidoreductase
MKLGAIALRATVGPLMIGHGTQKLFGWFGGHGLEGTGGFFEKLGLRPGREHAELAGAAEALGGALITAGCLTPVGASMVSGSMITAIRTAHRGTGPWATSGGWEYPAVLVATMTALAENGPGPLSVDGRRFPRLKGLHWALLSLGAACAGSYLVTSGVLRRMKDASAEPATDEAPAPAEEALDSAAATARRAAA